MLSMQSLTYYWKKVFLLNRTIQWLKLQKQGDDPKTQDWNTILHILLNERAISSF